MTHVEIALAPSAQIGTLHIQEMTVLYLKQRTDLRAVVTRSEGWIYGGPGIIPVLRWKQGGRASTDITEHQREWLSR